MTMLGHEKLVFCLFAFTIILSVLVLTFASPVIVVLTLIALFFIMCGVFIVHGAEFIGFLYVLVYIGAVLVLFLWVVMTMRLKNLRTIKHRFFFTFILLPPLFFILISYYIYPAIQLVRITPDNLLFQYYIMLLKKNTVCEFVLQLANSSKPFIKLCHFYPPNFVKVAFVVMVPKQSWIQTICLLHASQIIVLPYPITETSFFFQEMYLIFFDVANKQTSFEKLLAHFAFLHAFSQLNLKNNFFFPIKSLDYYHVLVLFLQPDVYAIYGMLGLNTTEIVFVRHPFLAYYIRNTAKLAAVMPDAGIPQTLLSEMQAKVDWANLLFSDVNENVVRLAKLLYFTYGFELLLVGLILLIALVGSVELVKTYVVLPKSRDYSVQLSKKNDL